MGIKKQRKPAKGDRVTFVENGSVYEVEAVTKHHVYLKWVNWDGSVGHRHTTRGNSHQLNPTWIG